MFAYDSGFLDGFSMSGYLTHLLTSQDMADYNDGYEAGVQARLEHDADQKLAKQGG